MDPRSLPFVVPIAPSAIATAVTTTYGVPFANEEAGCIGFCHALSVQQVTAILPDEGCYFVSMYWDNAPSVQRNNRILDLRTP